MALDTTARTWHDVVTERGRVGDVWVTHESPWKPATRNQRLLAVLLLPEKQREDGLAGLITVGLCPGAGRR